jgi:hypothetical protein
MVLSEYRVLVKTPVLTGGRAAQEPRLPKNAVPYWSKSSRHNPLRLVRRKQEHQLKYVLEGRVVTMDAASIVLLAGAVYIDGQNVTAVQDSAAIKAGLNAFYPT